MSINLATFNYAASNKKFRYKFTIYEYGVELRLLVLTYPSDQSNYLSRSTNFPILNQKIIWAKYVYDITADAQQFADKAIELIAFL